MNSPGLIERVWWRQRPWLDYGAKLVRYYSLRRYRLQFNPSIPAAGVSHELKTIWLNPRWPTPPEWLGEASASGEASAMIRCLKPGRDFHLAMLKGFLAHEAGHIRFSCAKPNGLLGDLWNALEDERVERLMAKDHPELRAPFTLLGDLFAAKARATFTGDALEGCLLWRWCWDQKAPLWHSTDPRWAEVKPLVERAWRAPSSEDVIAIAREILALLNLPEEQPPDPRFDNLGADGGGAEEDDDAEQGAGDGTEQQPGGGSSEWSGEALQQAGGSDEQGGGEGDDEQQPGGGEDEQQPGYGNKNRKRRGGKEPTPPSDQLDEVEGEAAGILLDIDGYARDLAEALKPLSASRLARPHRTRGRFAYDRFRAGSERCYRLKPVEHNRPLEVRVCLDLSSSMGELSDPTSNMHFAMRSCALVVQACAIASVPITVYGFNFTTRVLVEKGITGDEALMRLARVATGGSTLLGPALERVMNSSD
jgi:hypothetical protein